MDKFFSLLAGISGTLVSFLLGDWTTGLNILATMMVLDFCTGLMKGIYYKRLDSKVGFKGVLKKFSIIIVIILANLGDTLIGNEDPIFKTMAIYFYIAIEGISLIENLKLIGVPIPDFITQFFNQLKERGNNKEN